MKLRQYIGLSVLMAATFALQSMSVASVAADKAPNTTLEDVKAIFGGNLETNDPSLKELLLAIGIERTRESDYFQDIRVGIPYIVDATPEYWAEKLASGNRDIDTLVNSALLILFTDNDIPRSNQVVANLLGQAASLGYWPASTYMANIYGRELIKQSSLTPLRADARTLRSREIAELRMDHLNACAAAGFAPCQYQIGFWLSESREQVGNGFSVLREAVRTTLSDPRYTGYVDQSFQNAVAYIYDRGEEFGLSSAAREQYLDLLNSFSATPGQSALMW
tara:strand:+ start:12679 stop:13515 length:837 start_codon:yes stop_codon:yes gene_type:complete